MTKKIWLNKMHACQRDIATLMKAAGHYSVVSSHTMDREDIFMTADHWFVEPDEFPFQGETYAEWALSRATALGVVGMLGVRHREGLIGAREKFASRGIRLAAGATKSEIIDLCDQKDQFTERMLAVGIPAPQTIAASAPDDLASAIDQLYGSGLEVCVKPAVGVYGMGFWKFKRGVNAYDLFSGAGLEITPDRYVDAYAGSENPPRVIVMEYLPGVESSVDCVCDEGKIVAHAVRQKSSQHQTVFSGGPEYELAKAVVAELGLDGLVNVQTKEDRSRKLHVLEVNTRPSGGVGYSEAAGINLPGALAAMISGKAVIAQDVTSPVVIRRVDATIALPRATASLNGWTI